MEHYCGKQGWNPEIDPPCPACDHARRVRAATRAVTKAHGPTLERLVD